MIPAQWLPSLPPPANGWVPVYYEVSEASGILRQGEYRVDGDRVWARNDVGVRFLPRSETWLGRNAAYDPEGVSTLIVTLNQAVAALPPDERTQEQKAKLASKILSAASAGERDPS